MKNLKNKKEASKQLFEHVISGNGLVMDSDVVRKARNATDQVFKEDKQKLQVFLVAAIRSKIESAQKLMDYFQKLEKKMMDEKLLEDVKDLPSILALYDRIFERFEGLLDKLMEYGRWLDNFEPFNEKTLQSSSDPDADNLVQSGIVNSDSRRKIQVAYQMIMRLSSYVEEDGQVKNVHKDEEIHEDRDADPIDV